MAEIIYILYIGYLLLTISLILFSRKTPILRFSWMVFVLFVPVVGLILYLIIGSETVLSYRKDRIQKKHGDALKALEAMASSKDSGGDSLLKNYCGSKATADNEVVVFTDGTSKYQSLFNDLRQASDSIHVQYFSINRGEVGQELISILANKAQAGIEVKLLYDSIGCFFNFVQPLLKKLKQAGGQVAAIKPHALDVNNRNHRKIVVIDGEIGYTGGMNIGDGYRDGIGNKSWRDTHLRVTGGAVHQLQRVFLTDWLVSAKDSCLRNELPHYFPENISKGNMNVQIVANGLRGKYDSNDIINFSYFHLISRARERVWIQTPYFAPTDIILETLRGLARAGIDVRIMTSSSFVFGGLFHSSITNYFLRYLVNSGVKVYKHKGILHAKTMVVDDNTACIGSVNLNSRSLIKDDEIYAYFDDRGFVSKCQTIFEKDINHCVELDYEKFRRQSITSRALESAASLFSSLC